MEKVSRRKFVATVAVAGAAAVLRPASAFENQAPAPLARHRLTMKSSCAKQVRFRSRV